jgi:hypothetical protein
MKTVTVTSYRQDKYYLKVVKAIALLLKESDEISPVTIMLQSGHLLPKDHEAWFCGRVPYLERVFQGNLSKANRILRIIGFYAHDLNMVPSQHSYLQRGTKRQLRFSRTGDSGVETAYSRHFRWNQSHEKKQAMIEKILSEQFNASNAQSKAGLRTHDS